jgi:ribose transport system permease protein
MLPALVAVLVLGSVLSPSFLTTQNFETVLKITSVVGLLAVGQTLVVLSGGGGIDLSVGAVAALSAVVGALYAGSGLAAFIVAALLTGSFIGLINGLGVSRAFLQPFIVTLATMTIARGAAFYISGGTPVIVSMPELNAISTSKLWFVPVPAVLFIGAALLVHIVLRYTVWGREIYAVGGTEEAAYLSGVPVARRRLVVYIASGFLAGVAGVLLASFTATADANAASGYELSAIAAVVVGGTALSGGRGSIVGTMIGVLVIAFTGNILNLMNVDPFMQLLINGLIVLVAVSLEAQRRSGAARGRLFGLAIMYGTIGVGALLMFTVLAPH